MSNLLPVDDSTPPRASRKRSFLAMRTPSPAARPAHPFRKLRKRLLYADASRLGLLTGCDPADPFASRERRDVVPGRFRFRLRGERLAKISRQRVNDSRSSTHTGIIDRSPA